MNNSTATFLVEKRGKFLLHSPQLTSMLETKDLCLSSTQWPQTPQAFRRCSHFRREGLRLPFLCGRSHVNSSSLRSQSCGAAINSDLRIRHPMSRGPEAVRSRKFLPSVNTKLGTASSIYHALAFRWSS